MIYYLRHGETIWNRQQRLQGRADSPLSLWGVRLAITYGEHLSRSLDDRDGIAIHASPLGRALQTATIIADLLGVGGEHVHEHEALSEHDVGSWMGRDWSQIEAEFGVSWQDFRSWELRPPNGETRQELFDRVSAWLSTPRPERVSIVVGHGGVSRVFRGAYLGLEPDAIMNLPVHTHGRLYRLSEGAVEEIVADETPPPPEVLLG